MTWFKKSIDGDDVMMNANPTVSRPEPRTPQQRAAEAYHDHSGKLPDSLSKISYEDYRNIQFRSDQALWRNQALFEVQFFHRGFAYDRRVNVTEVGDDGMLRSINYEPSQFEFGKGAPPKDLPPDLGS